MLDLSDPNLRLASGGGRVVYQHPQDETSIVKVFRSRKEKPRHAFHPSHRRFGRYRECFDEYKHYITAMSRHGRCPDYLPDFRGFADTTEGIGQVFEKITDEGRSELAPTLKAEIASGEFDAEKLAREVRKFFAAIKRDRVIIRDLKQHNLCVVHNREGEVTRIVAVDGLGDFTLIPLRSMFGAAYDRWHARTEKKILSRIPVPASSQVWLWGQQAATRCMPLMMLCGV